MSSAASASHGGALERGGLSSVLRDLVKPGDENLREMNKKLRNMLEEQLTKNMHLQKVSNGIQGPSWVAPGLSDPLSLPDGPWPLGIFPYLIGSQASSTLPLAPRSSGSPSGWLLVTGDQAYSCFYYIKCLYMQE